MKWLFQFILIASFIRSFIYFFDSTLSPLNILMATADIYILINLRKRYSNNFVFILCLLLLFISIEMIYLSIFYRDIDQIKDFFYSTYIITLLFLAYLGVKEYGEKFLLLSLKTLLIIFSVLFIIVIYEALTGFHFKHSVSYNNPNINVPTAFFHNPNDLSIAVTIFFPLVFFLSDYFNKKIYKFLFSFYTVSIVIISLSRMAFVLLMCFPFFLLIQRKKLIKLSIILIFITILFSFLLSLKIDYLPNTGTFYNRTYNRIVTILKYNENAKDKSSSIHQRLEVYKIVIDKPCDYILGKGFQSGEAILRKNSRIDFTDPHSFLVETIFNVGFLGLIPILLFIFLPLYFSFINFDKHELYRFSLVQLIYFIFLINISSSIYRLSLVWIPLVFVYSLILNKQESEILQIS